MSSEPRSAAYVSHLQRRLAVVDQRDRYREALEEIARDVFSDRSLSAMKCAYIARDALAVSPSPAKESL